jgi:endonuclease/exonuclease/phosphatase family metal-dependent hydrolase
LIFSLNRTVERPVIASQANESDFGPLVETRLRIVTWNLWWRFGPWAQRAAAIEWTLANAGADVIALQEVWAEPDGRSQAAELARSLGFQGVYASDLEIEGIRFGNAVLSRWPIDSHESLPLPSLDAPDERRVVLRATVAGPRGPLQVFCTHLNWRFDQSRVRQAQVETLASFIQASPERDFPPILCGDLNATPTSDELRMLTGGAAVPAPPLVFHDAWEVAGTGPGFTWRNANPFAARALEPDRRIDYVLIGWPRAGGRGHVLRAEVLATEPCDGVYGSDHAAVLAEVRY